MQRIKLKEHIVQRNLFTLIFSQSHELNRQIIKADTIHTVISIDSTKKQYWKRMVAHRNSPWGSEPSSSLAPLLPPRMMFSTVGSVWRASSFWFLLQWTYTSLPSTHLERVVLPSLLMLICNRDASFWYSWCALRSACRN